MNDEAMIRIMSSLGLNFNPAEQSIKSFEAKITSLNQQLFQLKTNAIVGAKDINQAFASQLGSLGGNKTILDQFGQPMKTVQQEAQKAAVTIKDMVKSSNAMSSAYQSATNEAKKHAQTVQDMANQYNILGSQFDRQVSWFLSGSAFYGGINAATETVQTMAEVETGVTEIARVMEDSAFVFKDYRDELLQLGVDYAQTFDNVQDIALRWAQAGYNAKDSIENTRVSLLALNSAELDAKNATESLVGIMSQWGLKSSELELVLDKINKTADDFTVTSQDLVDGLLRSSGAAKIMGLSLDQTISLLTVMREASGRTGREVGNALNSILSYVQRPKSIDVLEGLGIQVFADKARTHFRNVMEIFQDIAARWDSLSSDIQDGFIKSADDAGLYSEELANAIGVQQEWNDLQQRDISQAAAGVYRRNYFIGMIERLSGAQKVLNNMTDAAGYSQKENARTLETLDAKYRQLIASAQALSVAIGDAGLLDVLKDLVDAGTDAINVFNKMDESTRSLIINLGLLYGAMKTIKAVVGMLGIGMGVGAAVGATATAGAAAQAGGLMAVLSKLPGWLKYVGLAGGAAFLTVSSNIREVNDKLKDQTKQVGELGEKYFKLQGQLSHSPAGTSQHEQIQRELQGLMESLATVQPTLIKAVDEHAKITTVDEEAILNQVEAYKTLTEIQKNQSDVQNDIIKKLEEIEASRKEKIDDINSENRALTELAAIYVKNRNENKDNIEVEKGIISLIGEKTWATIKGKDDIVKAINELVKVRQNEIKAIEENARKQKEAERDRLKHTIDTLEKELAANVAYLNYLQHDAPRYISQKRTATDWWQKPINFVAGVLDKPEWTLGELPENTVGKEISERAKILDEARKNLNKIQNEISNDVIRTSKTGGTTGNEETEEPGTDSKNKTNEALQNALRILEHRKHMNQISLEDEIKYLRNVEQSITPKYIKTGEERMDIEERIYDAESELKDKRIQDAKELQDQKLKDSTDWINYKKSLDQLSADEEIAAWRRVLNNQKDNIEARKEAVQNLYSLEKELREKAVEDYKKKIKDEQDTLEEAYKDRIDMIENEAKFKKEELEEEIRKVDEREKALDRDENKYDHDKKMDEINKDLSYWQVRTSKEAREKVVEIQKQIAEEEHDYDVEKQKQRLEDEKQTLQDKIDVIEKASEKEKEKWEKSYKLIEKAFDDHSVDIISKAGAMAKGAYDEWYNNYVVPLQSALKSGTPEELEASLNNFSGGTEQLEASIPKTKHDWGMMEEDYQTFMANSQQWKALANQGFKESMNAEMKKFHAENDAIRRKYGHDPILGEYPKFHQGAKTLSYGLAEFKPGELIFPPGLSEKLERLITVLGSNPASNVGGHIVNFNGTLFKADKVSFEDEQDMEIMSRELKRAVLAIK